MKSVFIAWQKFQRRTEAMSAFFDYSVEYLPSGNKPTISYPLRSIKTFLSLLKEKPQVIWVQLPPTVPGLVAIVYKLIFRKCVLIWDCHNGVFDRKWTSTPLFKYIINSGDIIIIHNKFVEDLAKKFVFQRNLKKIVILNDRLIDKKEKRVNNTNSHKYFVVPLSYMFDEPIDLIARLAERLGGYRFYFTGDHRKLDSDKLATFGENCIFTGFLTTEQYDELIEKAFGVVAMTNQEFIQQSAACEAISYEIPSIMYRTNTSVSLFDGCALFIDENSDLGVIQKNFEVDYATMRRNTQLLYITWSKRWEEDALSLAAMIETLVANK